MGGPVVVAVYRDQAKWVIDARFVDEIRRAAEGRFEIVGIKTDAEFERELGRAEVMFGWHLTAENVPRATNLRWVQATSAGIEYALFPEFLASGITLTSATGIHAIQISEHVFGMMLSLSRRFPHFARMQAKKKWDRSVGDTLGEVYGKTLGIVGLGAIGEALAARAKAFSMRVIGVKRSPLGYRGAADEAVATGALERVAREADYLVSLLPNTPETRGLISAEIIAAMKPTAYFVNLGRGTTVDEKALVEALSKGKIAGAGLDVFTEEPLPRKSALWAMENVIITPHVGGLTPHYWERATGLFIRNLAHYAAGEELENVVDKDIGY